MAVRLSRRRSSLGSVAQVERFQRADRQLANRIDIPLILFVGLTRAVGRYL